MNDFVRSSLYSFASAGAVLKASVLRHYMGLSLVKLETEVTWGSQLL